jgi:hypothetical protein
MRFSPGTAPSWSASPLRGDSRRAGVVCAVSRTQAHHHPATVIEASTTNRGVVDALSALIHREIAWYQGAGLSACREDSANILAAIPYNDSIPAPVLRHALAEEGRRLVERMRGIQ